jgi:HEAT repeat protein
MIRLTCLINMLCAIVLVYCETREKKLDRLIQQFRQGKDEERERAACALGNICYILGDTPKVQQAVVLLEKALTDKNPNIRSAAASALGDIGNPAQRAIKELGKRLEDEDARVRANTAWTIVRILQASEAPVPGQKELVPSLLKALQDRDDSARAAAVRALSKISPTNDEVLRAIASLARDKQVGVRCEVADAFQEAGNAGKPFLDRVKAMLEDESETVRQKAARAIELIEKQK